MDKAVLKKVALFFLIAVVADRIVKLVILGGFRWDSPCLSITYALNDGVAFSMLAFLKSYLKYVQVVVIGGMALYLFKEGYFHKYPLEIGLVFGSGVSNLADRFVYTGVVDYVYWHCGFNFAIFNLADVLIDVGIALILYKAYRSKKI
jgi:signal peptidase II